MKHPADCELFSGERETAPVFGAPLLSAADAFGSKGQGVKACRVNFFTTLAA
jgi:hypothetical protein